MGYNPGPAMDQQASFARALIIANPISGQGQGAAKGRELADGLARRGVTCELFLTTGRGAASEAAQNLPADTDLVISVGGDGTLREVLTGLGRRPTAGAGVSIGVLPMGTGNVLGIDLKLSSEVEPALDSMLAGNAVEMDVADVNGQLSFLVIGVGPDAEAVKYVDEHRINGLLSKWSYLPAAVHTFFRYRAQPLSVELDGEQLEGTYSQIMCSNLIHYGGVIKLAPQRKLDDGLFEVFLFRRGDRLSLLLYIQRLVFELVPGGSIKMRRARKIKISAKEPVLYHVDGDPMGETPVEIQITGVRYRMLVPTPN